MRSFLFFCTFLFLFSFGCKKEKPTPVQIAIKHAPLDSLSDEKINVPILKLSSQTKKDLEDFEDFQNLKKMVLTLNKSNAFYIKKYADSVGLLTENVTENLTKELKINTITSRLVVLSTEIGIIKQLIENENPDPKKLLEANKKLVTAYNSLVIQLNELTLAIPENIEKELLRELKDINGSATNEKIKK